MTTFEVGPSEAGPAAQRERELAWLCEEVAGARVPEVDPAGWRGQAATMFGNRLIELSYFIDEAARHLAAARDSAAREARLVDTGLGEAGVGG